MKSRFFLFLIPLLGLATVSLIVLIQTEWFRTQFLEDSGYLRSMVKTLNDNGLFSTIYDITLYRFEEITQLLLNFPKSKLPLLDGYYLLIGLSCWTPIVRGARVLFRHNEQIAIYFFCYTIVLFSWPYFDARFWIPVLPFMGLVLLLAIRTTIAKLSTPRRDICRKILLGLAFCYITLGCLALLYSSRLTFAGENFGDLYEGGARASVNNSFLKGTPIDSKSEQEKLQLHILERFQ